MSRKRSIVYLGLMIGLLMTFFVIYKDTAENLNAEIDEFKRLDTDPRINCVWECLQYDIFERRRNTLTGRFIMGNFVCHKHKISWTQEQFTNYKLLRKKWQNMRQTHKRKTEELERYEKLSDETQQKLDNFISLNSGELAKITKLTNERVQILKNLQDKKSEITRIQSEIDDISKQ